MGLDLNTDPPGSGSETLVKIKKILSSFSDDRYLKVKVHKYPMLEKPIQNYAWMINFKTWHPTYQAAFILPVGIVNHKIF